MRSFRERNASPAVQARLLLHTAQRGVKHPLRAARKMLRVARQLAQSAAPGTAGN